MIDTYAAVRALLAASGAVTSLTDDRIWCPITDIKYDPKQGAAINFLTRGGSSHAEAPVVYPSVQVGCWAATPEAARALWGVVHDALHQLSNVVIPSLGFLLWSRCEVQGHDFVDPDTKRYAVIGFFSMALRS
jgi:hypothetical protein